MEDVGVLFDITFRALMNDKKFIVKSIEPGKTPVYTRSVTGTLTYDDGHVRNEDPIFERVKGREAIDIVTGGLWSVILGK